MDERADARPAPFQPQLFAREDAQDRLGNDAVQGLGRATHVGRPREGHGKAIGLLQGEQVHVAGGLGDGIRRTGIERGIFADHAAGAAVNFRRGSVHEFLQARVLSQPLVQPDHGQRVGAIPMLGILPTLSDHSLGGKVHHVIGLELVQRGLDLIEIAIEVQLPEGEAVVRRPAVRQEDRVGLGRAADAEHFGARPPAGPPRSWRPRNSCCR